MADIAQSLDFDSYWMPFSGNRQFKADPRLIVAADGCHYTDADGRRVFDSLSGLWCASFGHGRDEIASAIAKTAKTLDYAPPFQYAHPMAFELAERVKNIVPGRARTRVLHQLRFGIRRYRDQDRACLLGQARPAGKDAPDRAREGLSWRQRRRHRHGRHPRQQGVFRRHADDRAPAAYADRGQSLHPRGAGARRRSCGGARAAYSRPRRRHRGRGDGRADERLGRCDRAARRLSQTAARDLRSPRYSADLRRGADRFRACGRDLRRRTVRRDAGYHDAGQEPDQRRGADGRRGHERCDLRHVHERRSAAHTRWNWPTAIPIPRIRWLVQPGLRRWISSRTSAWPNALRKWRRISKPSYTV